MSFYRCLAAPKTTLKRCRNSSRYWNKVGFCAIHDIKEVKSNDDNIKEFKIQHYNGSIYTFGESINDVKSFTEPIYLWKIMNRQLANPKSRSQKKILEKQAKIIRCGNQNKIIKEFLKVGFFENSEKVIRFFQKKNKKLKKENLEKARHFLGVIYYFRKNKFLPKIQLNIRIKLAYGKQIDIITKIQKWFRYRIWIKKLPVKPELMRKKFIPNTDKIIILQRNIRKFISIKVKHSHNCPYSLEDYWEIPKKYRIVYKHKEGNHFHWRYYHILWLHNDFLQQTATKRYVVEPVTKEEFPESFIEEIARKTWYLTRKKNDYLENEMNHPYKIENDWGCRFQRRSLYRFSLMLLDLCNEIGIEINNIRNWRKSYFKLKYSMFYLEVMPTLRNIAMSIRFDRLDDIIYYLTRDMFRMDVIFTDTDISDEIAGDAIYGILKIILIAKRYSIGNLDYQDNYNVIKSIIKENFETRLIE